MVVAQLRATLFLLLNGPSLLPHIHQELGVCVPLNGYAHTLQAR